MRYQQTVRARGRSRERLNLAGQIPGITLQDRMRDAVDIRIAGKLAAAALPIYTTQTHTDVGPFVRNAGFWGADLVAGLTGASPSNSAGAHLLAVTAITRQHVLGIKHGTGYPADGSTIRFVDVNNNVITRAITQHFEVPENDFTVMRLASDLPAEIAPVKVAPDNIFTYLRRACVVPVMTIDQEEKGLVADMVSIWAGGAHIELPANSQRAAFYEVGTAGDSGDPWLGIINGEWVLFGMFTQVTDGAGPIGRNSVLNAAIVSVDALGGGSSTGYTVSNPDLSSFPIV